MLDFTSFLNEVMEFVCRMSRGRLFHDLIAVKLKVFWPKDLAKGNWMEEVLFLVLCL